MKKTRFKKSLSFIMAVLMVMSCWVFVAPQKAEAANITDLGNIISQYEGYMTNGTFYTNMVANYTAYNNAKRYYDAVTYGGVEFNETIATQYYNAVYTAFGNTDANTSYTDWLNTSVISRDTKADIGAAYHKNVIWYPYDFSFDFVADGKLFTTNGVQFKWTIPNMIVGITSEQSTIPLHFFILTTSGGKNLGAIVPVNGQLLKLVPWKLGESIHYSNSAVTSYGNDVWGAWTYNGSGTTFSNSTSLSSVGISQNYYNQASIYVGATSASTGVTASNPYFRLDTAFNFYTANGNNTGTKYAGTDIEYGRIYFVYMEQYRQYWDKWDDVLPNLSYAGYNGYTYDAIVNNSIAANLDVASSKNFTFDFDESLRNVRLETAHDDAVKANATSAETGATYIGYAYNTASSATKVTTKYNDLISAISNANAIYNAGGAPYTDASWTNFVNAYSAARGHMAALNPSGSNVQYSSDATTVGNLATALVSAQSALEYRTYDVTFDNLFDYSNFAISTGSLTVDERTDIGFTITSTSGTDANTGFSSAIPVEAGKTYIFSADAEFVQTSGGYDMYVHTLDANMAGETTATADTSNGAHREGDVYISLTGQTKNKTPYIRFTAGGNTAYIKIRFDANSVGNKLTVNNIRVYEEGKVADNVSYETSKKVTYGSVYGALPTPTRTGYTFAGWVDAQGNAVTAGTVCSDSSAKNLYSTWTANKYTVKFVNAASTTVSEKTYDYGTTPTAPANTAAYNDTVGHHTFAWPTIEAVTGNVTYTETESIGEHTVVTDAAVEATCTTPGKTEGSHCSVCGIVLVAQTEVPATGHTPGAEATCTTPQTCTVCGAELAATLGHSYVATVTAPTCTAQGYTTHTCSVCGDSYKDTYIDARGHTPGAAATCTAPQTCTVCGTELAEALGHTEVVDAAVAATCTKTGLTEGKHCSVCGTVTVAQTETPMIEHSWDSGKVTTPPTCISNGVKTYTCSVCGATKTGSVAATGVHVYGEWTVEQLEHSGRCTSDPTCTETIKEAHTKSEEVKTFNDTMHYYKCEKCTAYGYLLNGVFYENLKEECYGSNATFTQLDENDHTVKCICGNTKTAAHNWIEDESKHIDATCENAGYEFYTCSDCKATKEETPVATGHDFTGAPIQATDSTHSFKCVNDGCSAAGTMDGETANVGGTVDCDFTASYAKKDEDEIYHTASCLCGNSKDDPHVWTGWVPDSENADDGTGKMSNTCSKCHYEKTSTCTYEKTDNYEAATCTENGYQGWKCSECSNGYTEILTATGHTSGEAVTENNVAPTCTVDGSYDTVVYCTVCDAELSRVETIVDALGHEFAEIVTANAATCIAEGNEAYKQCTVCNKFFAASAEKDSTDAKDSEDAFKIEIDGNNHETTTSHEQTDATCTDVGYTAGTYCEDCDTWVSGHEEIPAIAHKNKVHHEKVDATCANEGTIEYWSCPDCNKNFSDEECTTEVTNLTIAINPNNHDLKTTAAKAPTCTEIGWDAYVTCSRCDYTTYVEKAALNHNWDDGTVTKNPTCTEKGIMTYTCKNDVSHTYEDDINALNHIDTDNNGYCDRENCGELICDHVGQETVLKNDKKETCLTDGYSGDKHCAKCDIVVESGEKIPATGHKDENKDHVCDNGCDVYQGTHADGNKDHNCDYGCKEAIGTCEDKDLDHYCDYGCEKTYGTCEDADKDHTCDYGCDKVYGEHVDENTDHVCDYGCKEAIGTCEDKDLDHDCDYGCDKLYGEHVDANTDHVCDYGCDKVYGTHEDTNSDHKCEYGCSVAIGTCEDNDKDHKCDYGCDKYYREHKDSADDDDHACDYGCGAVLEGCADGDDNNHNCDICDKEDISDHVWVDADCTTPKTCSVCGVTDGEATGHDYVGVVTTEPTCTEKGVETFTCQNEASHTYTEDVAPLGHIDDDNNGRCDRCGTLICDHKEQGTNVTDYKAATCLDDGYTGDTRCNKCNEITEIGEKIPATGHKDENKDHVCDNGCGIEQGTCSDSSTDDDHLCDYGCGKVLEACSDIADDGDHECDICGADDVTAHEKGSEIKESVTEATCGKDGSYNSVYYCTECNTEMQRTDDVVIPATGNHTEGEVVTENEVKATCTIDGSHDEVVYCTVCNTQLSRENVVDKAPGHTEGETVTENNVAPTCTVDGSYDTVVYCTVCGDELSRVTTTVDALGHEFTVFVETVAPTCTVDGYTTYKCSRCTETEDRDIVVAAHKLTKTEAKEETCEGDGNIEYWTCSACGKLFEDEAATTEITQNDTVTSAKGHKYTATNTVDPTCTTQGYTTYECDNCTSAYDSDFVDKLGHDYDLTTGTDNNDGTHTVACTRCAEGTDGHTDVVDCTYGEDVVTDPTCTKVGFTTHTCTACGYSYTDTETQANGHSYGEWTPNNDGTHTKTCTVCTDEEGRAVTEVCADSAFDDDCLCDACSTLVAHNYGNADCLKPATCTVCGATTGEALGHSFTNYASDGNATCLVDGTKTAKCDRCNVTNTVADEGSAKGHTPAEAVREKEVAATCYAEGSYDEVVYCSVEACKAEISRTPKTIEKIAHTEGEAVIENKVESTCYSEGSYDEVIYCSVCEAAGKTTELSRTPKTIEKIAHTPAEAVREKEVAATCYAEGSYDEVIYCSVCEAAGETTELSRIPKTIEKIAHTPAEAVREKEVAATCYAEGSYDEVVYCSVEACKAELSRTPKTIEKIAHTEGEAVIENKVESTCYSEGSCDEVIYCSVCEAAGKTTELSRTPKTIEKIAHTPAEAVREKEVAATCTVDGSYDAVVCCKVCGKELSREEIIVPALGHKGNLDGGLYIAPSCTKQGVVEKVCTVCNEKYDRNEIKATGHKYSENSVENVVIIPATCTAQGSKYFVCVLCGYENLEEKVDYGTPTGHYIFVKEGYAPTCTEEGLTDYIYCLREGCDYEVHAEKIKATGHKAGEDGKCAGCGDQLYEGGSKACSCICHKDSGFMKFIYKIVLFFWKLFRIKSDCACGGVHY